MKRKMRTQEFKWNENRDKNIVLDLLTAGMIQYVVLYNILLVPPI